jgi:hypothetical protein
MKNQFPIQDVESFLDFNIDLAEIIPKKELEGLNCKKKIPDLRKPKEKIQTKWEIRSKVLLMNRFNCVCGKIFEAPAATDLLLRREHKSKHTFWDLSTPIGLIRPNLPTICIWRTVNLHHCQYCVDVRIDKILQKPTQKSIKKISEEFLHVYIPFHFTDQQILNYILKQYQEYTLTQLSIVCKGNVILKGKEARTRCTKNLNFEYVYIQIT